jgi:hypothetical protein
MERRVRWGDDWWEGLRLHLEVWDGRDGLRMLSAEGRLGVNENGNVTVLHLTGSDRHEVVGPAFSAASRDPEHHRFADIEDYFCRAHFEGTPAELCARVVVRDVRSGRRAVLWESSKHHRWASGQVSAFNIFAAFLPQGSVLIGTNPNPGRSIVYPPCGAEAEREEVEEIIMGFNFYVRPEAGQGGVPARDKQWRLVGADAARYGEHDSTFSMAVRWADKGQVGRFVWALLLG